MRELEAEASKKRMLSPEKCEDCHNDRGDSTGDQARGTQSTKQKSNNKDAL